jgi:hypothetical protein
MTHPYWESNPEYSMGVESVKILFLIIQISLTRAIQVFWMCDSCYHDESASSDRFWPYLGEKLMKISRKLRCRADSITMHDDIAFNELSVQTIL